MKSFSTALAWMLACTVAGGAAAQTSQRLRTDKAEVVVETVEAKAKLSQNRSAEDRAGVARGLAADGRDPEGLVEE